jgi:hypothetical protein
MRRLDARRCCRACVAVISDLGSQVVGVACCPAIEAMEPFPRIVIARLGTDAKVEFANLDMLAEAFRAAHLTPFLTRPARSIYRSRDRNVCLLAPLRRPKPMATPGALIGRLAISESVAIPVPAARSYQ